MVISNSILASHLFKEEFLRIIQENKIVASIVQTIEPIIDAYIQDNTNYAPLAADGKAIKVDTRNASIDGKPAQSQSKTLEYLGDKDEEVADVDGMHKQIALAYYAICWLFEVFKKGQITFLKTCLFSFFLERLIDEVEINALINLLMEVLGKKRTSRHVREITLHTLLRIVRVEQHNGFFMKPGFIALLIGIAGNKNFSLDVNKTANEILAILSKIPDIEQYIQQNEEFAKLSIRAPTQGRTGIHLPQVKSFSNTVGAPSPLPSTSQQFQSSTQDNSVSTLPSVNGNRRMSGRSSSINRAKTPRKDEDNLSLERADSLRRKPPIARNNNYELNRSGFLDRSNEKFKPTEQDQSLNTLKRYNDKSLDVNPESVQAEKSGLPTQDSYSK